MPLPFFYNETIEPGSKSLLLNEETSRHVVQVLRMKIGEPLQITDGKGNLFMGEITDDHKKRTEVEIVSSTFIPPPPKKVIIAISLLKNANRFEWFLEKATEIGVSGIVPLICSRTEKQHFRFERMKGILISAMLQSQQCWLPVLNEPVKFNDFNLQEFEGYEKFIAHCIAGQNRQALHLLEFKFTNRLILIGPEGDFTEAEIQAALNENFIPVSLGDTRLRTETAGMVAVAMLQLGR